VVELLIVTAIVGVLAAIAIPRVSAGGDNARASGLAASVRTLQYAVDLYAAEHVNRGPTVDPDGSVSTSGLATALRLMRQTDDFGNLGGIFGPYLRNWPTNPYNGKRSIRVDGPAAGTNVDGWRISSSTLKIEPDHGNGAVQYPTGGGIQPVDEGPG
jgi:type II secretory pathway pseudopilin PulG